MEDKYKIPYINACIKAFAKRFDLSATAANEYLDQNKGMDLIEILFMFSPYLLPRLTIVSSNLHCFGSKLLNRQQHLQLTEGVQSHRTQPGSPYPYIDPDIH